jgi:hypothetical protein
VAGKSRHGRQSRAQSQGGLALGSVCEFIGNGFDAPS